ncbi:MAG TPA: methylmalonyl Co-A mutase-associated GTPase MeaB [Vicinamibacterales bacterium]|nr:methylmalonyl Co-A mutase-associated GTPase MeaB [Vicinamibacterales bacterium]
MTAPTLSERVLAGDIRAVARAISFIENEAPEGAALIGRVFPTTGRSYLVGVTGPPGAGKSTLVDRLTTEYRAAGHKVGIIAVDPTSPYSGGAILGDRVRMQAHAIDDGVFIRSMATRGNLGGLSRATAEAALVLDAAGFDIVIIETVGVGQDEVDIVRTADVSIVTIVPGAGDEVQALKAGIMEIADIFVVNKADREGADRTAASVEGMLAMQTWAPDTWRPPIMKTEATTGKGVPELVESIGKFREHTKHEIGQRRRMRAEFRLRELLGRAFMRHLEHDVLTEGEFERELERIAARQTDPYAVSEAMIGRALGGHTWAIRMDHLGIAVTDIDAALRFWRDALGLNLEPAEEVASQRVRAHFMPAGGAAIELLEATAPDSPIAKFAAKRGAGLHHVTFEVPDIAASLAKLKAAGVKLIDETARPGAHGSLVAFIHPSSAHGVLVELKQRGSRPQTPDSR